MNLEERIKKLETEISEIRSRNARVESNKAWEISIERKVLIALLTYVVMILVMLSLNIESPLISAIIPTLGFVISTLSLDLIKKYWLTNKR